MICETESAATDYPVASYCTVLSVATIDYIHARHATHGEWARILGLIIHTHGRRTLGIRPLAHTHTHTQLHTPPHL